jgi:hypothetical protein
MLDSVIIVRSSVLMLVDVKLTSRDMSGFHGIIVLLIMSEGEDC